MRLVTSQFKTVLDSGETQYPYLRSRIAWFHLASQYPLLMLWRSCQHLVDDGLCNRRRESRTYFQSACRFRTHIFQLPKLSGGKPGGRFSFWGFRMQGFPGWCLGTHTWRIAAYQHPQSENTPHEKRVQSERPTSPATITFAWFNNFLDSQP